MLSKTTTIAISHNTHLHLVEWINNNLSNPKEATFDEAVRKLLKISDKK